MESMWLWATQAAGASKMPKHRPTLAPHMARLRVEVVKERIIEPQAERWIGKVFITVLDGLLWCG